MLTEQGIVKTNESPDQPISRSNGSLTLRLLPQEKSPSISNVLPNVYTNDLNLGFYYLENHNRTDFDNWLILQLGVINFARKKKPTGRKEENRKAKLPNQIRHDENAAIAVGTWKKRNKNKKTQ